MNEPLCFEFLERVPLGLPLDAALARVGLHPQLCASRASPHDAAFIDDDAMDVRHHLGVRAHLRPHVIDASTGLGFQIDDRDFLPVVIKSEDV